MEKNIVFIDWHNTLSWSKYWESLLGKNTDFTKVVDDFFAFEKEMEAKWMLGKLRSEDIVKLISSRSGLSEDLLWQTFVSDCQKMHIDPKAISLIKKIKEKYIVVLVTGNMDCFSRFTVPALGLDKLFDRIINSADVGYLKTDYDGKTFTDCFKQYSISDFSKSFLLDDSEKTCTLFDKIGGRALRVNAKEDTITHLNSILKNNHHLN